jgi:hypothetical protein
VSEPFVVAKALADELARQWVDSFSKREIRGEGIPVTVKAAPDPKQHFEVRVREGAIVILCRTATANGWHRIRRLHGHATQGVLVRVVFEPMKLADGNYLVPTIDEDEDDTHVIGGEG